MELGRSEVYSNSD